MKVCLGAYVANGFQLSSSKAGFSGTNKPGGHLELGLHNLPKRERLQQLIAMVASARMYI
jgi:hypothetical protein